MTEEVAPVGNAEGIVHVPVSADTPVSPHEAARELAAFWNKREEEQNKPAEAPTKAAEPETPPQADDAAPAEQATSEEATETPEPADELPPIEAPRSWTKEQKAEFSNLPREAQQVIAAREQDRETALRRGQNELAEQRKAIEAERVKVEQARQQYEQALPQLLQAVKDSQSGEFADVKSQADIDKLASEDWPRFARYQAHLMKIGQLEHEAKQAQERQQNEFKNKWSEFAAKEDAKFLELAPEMADKDKATKVADASVSLLKDIGFSEADLAKLWNGEASLSLRDHRAQLLIRDAARYRDAQTAVPKKVAAKPVPPVQKPGVAQSRASDAEARIKDLKNKLDKSGDLKDAVALYEAQQQAAR